MKVIEVKEVSIAILRELIKFIYDDEVKIHEDNAIPLYEAARLYKIPKLQRVCKTFLEEHIEDSNAADYFQVSILNFFSVFMLWLLSLVFICGQLAFGLGTQPHTDWHYTQDISRELTVYQCTRVKFSPFEVMQPAAYSTKLWVI
jgi:hypothetical protein